MFDTQTKKVAVKCLGTSKMQFWHIIVKMTHIYIDLFDTFPEGLHNIRTEGRVYRMIINLCHAIKYQANVTPRHVIRQELIYNKSASLRKLLQILVAFTQYYYSPI